MQAMVNIDDDATITQLCTAWVGVALVRCSFHTKFTAVQPQQLQPCCS